MSSEDHSLLQTGMASDLSVRLHFLHLEARKERTMHTYRNCLKLLYWEQFVNVQDAMVREQQLKGWTRKRMIALISGMNPQWLSLNEHAYKLSEQMNNGH